MSKIFTKGSHHRNVSLVLIKENLFHQCQSSCQITVSSNYIAVFKNPTDMEGCKHPHIYLLLDLSQSINDLLRFRTKIFPVETCEFLHLYKIMNSLKSQLQFLHFLKDSKPQVRRALLASADDELIKAIVGCSINTLNGNHKLIEDERSKLKKHKNRFRA